MSGELGGRVGPELLEKCALNVDLMETLKVL